MMYVTVEYSDSEPRSFEGDIAEIIPRINEAVREGLYYGQYIVVTTERAEMHDCRKCGLTVSSRARRGQATESTKGYYVCPKCGYMKEGVVP
jgi:predicted RNA-binding Zn-ribbon protein involved in translation (DUF1610 family)